MLWREAEKEEAEVIPPAITVACAYSEMNVIIIRNVHMSTKGKTQAIYYRIMSMAYSSLSFPSSPIVLSIHTYSALRKSKMPSTKKGTNPKKKGRAVTPSPPTVVTAGVGVGELTNKQNII